MPQGPRRPVFNSVPLQELWKGDRLVSTSNIAAPTTEVWNLKRVRSITRSGQNLGVRFPCLESVSP